jgi:hypothetical protein
MKRFLISAITLGAAAISLSPASAYVLGQWACRNGNVWTCLRCGSESSEIMTANRYQKDDHPVPYADNASRFRFSAVR